MDHLLENPTVVMVLTLAAAAVVFFLFLLILSGGDGGKIGLALRCFRRALRDRAFAKEVAPLLAPPKSAQETPPKPSGVPLRLLALLQRESRLVDFLLEDVETYSDAQIGAAVRDIHRHCYAALKKYLTLEPVLAEPEGSTVRVPAGFNPSAIQLVGNVTGEPPFTGTLRHQGWRVKEIKLVPLLEGQDDLVLVPAEVELP